MRLIPLCLLLLFAGAPASAQQGDLCPGGHAVWNGPNAFTCLPSVLTPASARVAAPEFGDQFLASLPDLDPIARKAGLFIGALFAIWLLRKLGAEGSSRSGGIIDAMLGALLAKEAA